MFDNDQDAPSTPNPREVFVQSENTNAGTRSTPGTTGEISSVFFPKTDRFYNGTHTDDYTHPIAETSSEQGHPNPTNTRSIKYYKRHNPEPNCKDACSYSTSDITPVVL